MATIYILEDDLNIQEIEAYALKNSGYQTEGFDNAREFFKKVSERVPSLLLLDIMLPDADGLDVLRKLRSMPETKKLPIILVTAKTSEIDKVKGLDVGADDYITKPFGIMELISRVKALLRRSAYVEEKKFLTLGNVFMDDEKHAVYVSDQVCELTYKEYELLKLLMSNAGIVTARDTIMERIWGIDFEGESRTLDMHIKTLRKKLGEAGSMIKTVRNVGYIMSDKENRRPCCGKKMKHKIYLQFCLIAALAILITTTIVTALFYQRFKAQVFSDVRTYAYVLTSVDTYDEATLIPGSASAG